MEKEIVARDFVLTLTILSIIFILAHQPTPVKSVQTDYCWIHYPAAAKDALGIWHRGFAEGFGPCSLLDRFEYI